MSWAEEGKLGKMVIRPEYLDLTGDLAAGVLLSQVVYWFRPGPGGHLKVKVERDGRFWIAKTQSEWCQEVRIGLKTFIRSMDKLLQLGVVVSKIYQYGNRPVLHVGLNLDVLIGLVGHCPPDGVGVITDQDYTKTEESIPPKGKNPLDQIGVIHSAISEESYIEQSIKESTKEISLSVTIRNTNPTFCSRKSVSK